MLYLVIEMQVFELEILALQDKKSFNKYNTIQIPSKKGEQIEINIVNKDIKKIKS
jgi:hypothetical protein